VLSILIPVLCVCVLPYEAVRWALIGVATLTSGLFLLLNFRGPDFDAAGAKCACSRLPRSVHPRSDANAHSCPPCTRRKNLLLAFRAGLHMSAGGTQWRKADTRLSLTCEA